MNNNIFEKMTNQLAETIRFFVLLQLCIIKDQRRSRSDTFTLGFIDKRKLSINQLLNKMNVNKAAIEL